MKNEYTRRGTAVYVNANKGKNPATFVVDREALPLLHRYPCWRVIWGRGGSGYVASHGWADDGSIDTKVLVMLGRLLMDCPDDKQVGYRNQNTLDCRKANLFIGDKSDTCKNRAENVKIPNSLKTGIAGILQRSVGGDYQVRKMVNGHKYRIGNFRTLAEAKQALEAFMQQHYG